jgi:DNA-binding CsgD family transcriptional regulator
MTGPRARRRAGALAAVLAVQALCAVFFMADVIADLRFAGWIPHTLFEALIAFALLAGVAICALELRRVVEDMRRADAAVSAASGALAEVIAQRFAGWGLTAAEADVALFALKGFDTAEIAELRGAAAGTVRAQLARVYAKAGVSNRAGLVALFLEDLLAGLPLPAAARPSAPAGAASVPSGTAGGGLSGGS